jgi:hypothetical protein
VVADSTYRVVGVGVRGSDAGVRVDFVIGSADGQPAGVKVGIAMRVTGIVARLNG